MPDHSKWRNIWICTSADECGNIALTHQAKAKWTGSMMVPFLQRDPTGAVYVCGYNNLIPNILRMHMHDYMPRRLEKNLYSQLPNGSWSGTLHTNFFFGPPIAYHTIIDRSMLSVWHKISLVFHRIHDNETCVHLRTCTSFDRGAVEADEV